MNNLVKIILIILVLNFLFKNNKENFSDDCGANQKLYLGDDDEEFCDCIDGFALDGSGNCQQAVSGAGAGTIGNGKLGETQVIVSGGKIIIDTKVKDGEVLNNSIQLQ